MRTAAAAAAALACVALTACGDDEATTTATVPAAAASLPDCLASFNDRAPDNLPRLARLAHKRGNDVILGVYGGPAFTARTFDEQISAGDRSRATIPQNACVVTEVTGALGPLYLFAVGDDGDWHNLSPTDPDVPFAKDPASELAAVQKVELSDVEPPEVPELVPKR